MLLYIVLVRFNPYHAEYFLCTTLLPNFYSINFNTGFQLLVCLFMNRVGNNVNPDQLASEKPADLDLHCFLNGTCPVLAW